MTYLAVDETVCGKMNANSKPKRRCSTPVTGSTSKMPGHQQSCQPLRRYSQQLGSRKTSVPIYSEMSVNYRSDDNNAVTVSSSRGVIADPESDCAYEDTAYNALVSDKRRRLIVSLFTAFVIMLIAVAIIMISATLSIGAGGFDST
jgi:hypothetical protein